MAGMQICLPYSVWKIQMQAQAAAAQQFARQQAAAPEAKQAITTEAKEGAADEGDDMEVRTERIIAAIEESEAW